MQLLPGKYDTYKLPSWSFYLIVAIVGFLPLFYHLGVPVINSWDESRRAVNAWEMLENGNYLVTHFNGEPDLWGSKPPLLIWFQVLSMKIFGPNEWALRFPSAMAGLFTGFLLLWFSRRYTGRNFPGLIAVLVLFTSSGYINIHSVRTGDFDSLLVLFTTAASLFFFLAIESEKGKIQKRYILAFFISLTFGALTKGIAAFLLSPAYLIYLVYRRQLFNWLKNSIFWSGFVILLTVTASYYIMREMNNPGYLNAVLGNEVTGRYFTTLENNKSGAGYYFRMLYQVRFRSWFYLIFPAIVMAGFYRGRHISSLLIYLLWLSVSYLLIISFSQTKLIWYDLQIFPYLSLIVAIFFLILFNTIRSSNIFKGLWAYPLIVGAILFFFTARPYYNIVEQNSSKYLPKQEEDESTQINQYLRKKLQNDDEIGLNTIVYEGSPQHFLFYIYKLRKKGYSIDFIKMPDVTSGNRYLVYQPQVLEHFKDKYEVEISSEQQGVYSLLINRKNISWNNDHRNKDKAEMED